MVHNNNPVPGSQPDARQRGVGKPKRARQPLRAARPAASPREAAIAIVADWLRDGVFPDRLLDERVTGGYAATQALLYNAVKWRRTLEWRIARVTTRPPGRTAMAVLLVAAAELFLMDESPPHAVVHESVTTARKRLAPAEVGFVNAVLRALLRDREAAELALQKTSPAVRDSHPDVLWQRWKTRFSPEAAQRLLEWNNTPAEVVIRSRGDAAARAAALEQMQAAGIAAVPHPARPSECLVLPRGIRVTDVPGYREGAFVVQDPATLVAVDCLAPQPGETILDACAAPGGKTVALADAMAGRGNLVAMDIEHRRIRRLEQNLARWQLPRVTVLQADLTAPEPGARQALQMAAPDGFDAVLLDVPCSNTGVLRRRPDARWRFDPAALAALTSLQHRLLTAAAAWIKPGGRIVYSTCSLEREENDDRIAEWLNVHPDFHLVTEHHIFPPDHQTDGAYCARMDHTKAGFARNPEVRGQRSGRATTPAEPAF